MVLKLTLLFFVGRRGKLSASSLLYTVSARAHLVTSLPKPGSSEIFGATCLPVYWGTVSLLGYAIYSHWCPGAPTCLGISLTMCYGAYCPSGHQPSSLLGNGDHFGLSSCSAVMPCGPSWLLLCLPCISGGILGAKSLSLGYRSIAPFAHHLIVTLAPLEEPSGHQPEEVLQLFSSHQHSP